MGIFDPKVTETTQTDVLIIGGGLAGIRAAIEARQRGEDVLLVSKSRVGLANNSAVALGAFAAAAGTGWRDPADRHEDHVRDTLEAGRRINDRRLVEVMVLGIEAEIRTLETYGVRFRKRDGVFAVTYVPGHSYPRTIYPDKGGGTSITRPMRDHALSLGVRFVEGVAVTRILRSDVAAVGALGVDSAGRATIFRAGAVVLAAGGTGRLYLHTDNPLDATGDGYALAYDAGLTLRDMEFVQFVPGMPPYEIWLVRGGAILRNRLGEDVMLKHGLAVPKQMTRDAVSRAAYVEVAAGLGVTGSSLIVDASEMPAERWERLRGLLPPRVRDAGRRFHMSPPRSHFFMGGVTIDERTATEVKGLFACGEICGGMHGANRLGSNALSECLVFGARAGQYAAEWARNGDRRAIPTEAVDGELERLGAIASRTATQPEGWLPRSEEKLSQQLRSLMWSNVGIIRDAAGLQQAIEEILHIRHWLGETPADGGKGFLSLLSLHSMATVAELIARSALARTESRGGHYRSDHPAEDDEQWLKSIFMVKGSSDDSPLLRMG
ncbi:MAG: FAD-dependent oxidoreductase [Chloroflexi bacterium]|nr:FAD-dependent oxidoreductase [Chloroflexota bacterium]